jgi:CRP-like cAMP-binding protein
MTAVPLMARKGRRQLEPGEVLFREGETPLGVYILDSGEIDLRFGSRDRTAKTLRVVTPGQMLGLSSVVMQRPHDCSAIARTVCEVRYLSRDEFLRSLEQTPAFWFSVLHMLSSDVNAVYHDIRTLVAG